MITSANKTLGNSETPSSRCSRERYRDFEQPLTLLRDILHFGSNIIIAIGVLGVD